TIAIHARDEVLTPRIHRPRRGEGESPSIRSGRAVVERAVCREAVADDRRGICRAGSEPGRRRDVEYLPSIIRDVQLACSAEREPPIARVVRPCERTPSNARERVRAPLLPSANRTQR